MRTDFEAFAKVRRPLPGWWVTVRREQAALSARGIVLIAARQNGTSRRFTVPIAVLCALAHKDKLSTAEIEVVWAQVEERFFSAARRRFSGQTNGAATLGVADI